VSHTAFACPLHAVRTLQCALMSGAGVNPKGDLHSFFNRICRKNRVAPCYIYLNDLSPYTVQLQLPSFDICHVLFKHTTFAATHSRKKVEYAS
jgi:hypothetical protein